jgi:hypothetical protein
MINTVLLFYVVIEGEYYQYYLDEKYDNRRSIMDLITETPHNSEEDK